MGRARVIRLSSDACAALLHVASCVLTIHPPVTPLGATVFTAGSTRAQMAFGEHHACTIVAAVAEPSLPTSASPLGQRFSGRLVVVEPLAAEHEHGLIEAAAEAELFRWMPVDMSGTADAVHQWLETSLQNAEAEREVPFAILDASSGQALGSTRLLTVR